MGAFKVETNYGDVMVRNCYDYDTGESYYEVYEPNTYEEECGYGKFIGEFNSDYDYSNDDERALFVDDLEDMLDDNFQKILFFHLQFSIVLRIRFYNLSYSLL